MLIRQIDADNKVILQNMQTTPSGLSVHVTSLMTEREWDYNTVIRGNDGAIIPIVQFTQRFCSTPLVIDNDMQGIYTMRRYRLWANYQYTYNGATTYENWQGEKYGLIANEAAISIANVPYGFSRIVTLQNFEVGSGQWSNMVAAVTSRGATIYEKDNIPPDCLVDFVINGSGYVQIELHGNTTSINVSTPTTPIGCAEAIIWYIDAFGCYQPLLLDKITYGDTTHGSSPSRHFVSGARTLYPNAPTQRQFSAEFTGSKELYDNLALTSGDIYYLGLPNNKLLPIDCGGVTRNGLLINFSGIVGL